MKSLFIFMPLFSCVFAGSLDVLLTKTLPRFIYHHLSLIVIATMRSQSTPRSSTQYSPIAKRAKTESITSPSTQHHEHHASHVTGSSSNIVSIIQTMKHQEFTTYRQLPYLTNNVEVTRSDRHAMCQWGFSILDACKVDRHFAIVALTFFDRFLSCRGLRSVEACLARQREFQLAYIVSYKLISLIY